ncbi:MAG: NDP-sugar synthase [Actinobacteria bacterium]|nr:NDP-sugar synthase [Actinomycetota bacterium]
MRAVVLVGGEGTRLRPLTETIPKPLLPLVDRPFLDHVLDHLVAHGVREVVLSSPYLESAFLPVIEARRGEPLIRWITEGTPLGTGGAIVNALGHVGAEAFLVLNGDILTDLDIGALVAHHVARGATATIALTPVADARPYGLVELDGDGRVLAFREKPAEAVPGEVNAGTYVLHPGALAGFPTGVPLSVEREVFPALIERGEPVHGLVSGAYWMDLGTPEKYLRAHFDLLEGLVAGEVYAAPYRAPSAEVDLAAHLGRWVVVGERATVGARAEVEDSVLHREALVGEGAVVRGSILGTRSRVEAGAVVTDAVLAEGAVVPAGLSLQGARVSAGRTAEA